MANYVDMINGLTGMEMSVPAELVETYKKAGHKLAAEAAKAEDFAASPDNGSEDPDNGSEAPDNGSEAPDNGSEPPDNGSEAGKKNQQKK